MTDDSVARFFLEDIIISVRKQNTDYIYQWESNKKKNKLQFLLHQHQVRLQKFQLTIAALSYRFYK